MDIFQFVTEFLNGFNIQMIISMTIILWYFTKEIKTSIQNLDKDIQAMNSRVSRLEGTLYGREVYKNIVEKVKK